MFCKNCGAEIDDKAVICPKCGVETAVREKEKWNALALTGFILAVISMVIDFYGIVGITGFVLSIVGFFQVRSRGGRGRGLAIAGIVMGAVAIIYAFLLKPILLDWLAAQG